MKTKNTSAIEFAPAKPAPITMIDSCIRANVDDDDGGKIVGRNVARNYHSIRDIADRHTALALVVGVGVVRLLLLPVRLVVAHHPVWREGEGSREQEKKGKWINMFTSDE